MRTIKFRAKIEATDAWAFGLPYAVYPENYIDSIKSTETNEDEYIKTDTLGQFTGLKDKNGVEIYEGDIVKFGAVGIVKYGEGRFFVDCYNLHIRVSKYVEVIGNIHDNPELIK